MSVLQKLKEQKEDIHARLIELKESIGEDETFNEDQMKQWDEATKQLAEVTAKIGTRERLLSIDGSDGNPGETNFTPRVNRRQMHDLDNAMRGWTLTQVNRPNELTRQMQDARGGLAWDEPIHANVKWDQTKGVDADGGFSVNEAIVAGVIRKMKDFGGMFEACNVFTTSNGAPLKKIVRDATSFRAQKTAELGNIANTTQKQEKVVFGAMDMTSGIYQTSMQLVRDTAFDILGEFQSDVSESLSRGANFYLTTGSQADEPQGIQGAVSVANAAWNAITHPNILRLMHSVDASYRRSNKCAFMCNDATVLAMKLTLIDADGRPLYKSQPNAVGGFDYVIEGKPVKINPDLADGQLLFGDFSKYHIRLVGGVMIQVLRELFALTGGIGIIGHSSIDGRLVDSTAIKKLVVA